MLFGPSVWVFNAARSRFPGGVFSTLERAEQWIALHRLTGVLTAYPLDEGTFDWVLAAGVTNLRPELLAQKRHDPVLIGGFSTASQEHYHYELGRRI